MLIVDDQPELRLLLRTRLGFEPDIEVVGEASNGEEAVRLTRSLAPSGVVLDLEMPVMRGDEAIPLMRAAAPGMGILLYTAAGPVEFREGGAPDATLLKGVPLKEVVEALRAVLDQAPFDVVRLELGPLPLRSAIEAFDTWIGLNMNVLEAIRRGVALQPDQLGGASPAQLEALMGIYAHLGNNLQKAARSGLDEVSPVIHVFREVGALARSALIAFGDDRLAAFWAAWGYEVPPEALRALAVIRDRLVEVLPLTSGAGEPLS